jgi:small-conductance mechanosensitive channel
MAPFQKKTRFSLLCLFIAATVALPAAAQSVNPLTGQAADQAAETEPSDIDRLVEILKDDQKRQELIERLESGKDSAPAGEKAPEEGEADMPLSEALWTGVAETGQEAAAYVEHTLTSAPALLKLLKRIVISLFLILAVYLLWRLVRGQILPRVRSGWALKMLSAVILGLSLASGLLATWGIDMYHLVAEGAGRAILASLLSIIFVVAVAYAAWEFINRMLYRYIARMTLGGAWDRRLQTMLPLIRSGLLAVLLVITVLVVLSELGINIAPLLAGAGIVGLAIGFGAQTLVKDLLTGFFVLLENTINVDDWVILGGHDGQVEGLTIRHVMVRDIYGNLHTVPWSSVVSITNQTRDFGFAVVEVGFAYRENIDEVVSVVKQVADEMRQDPDINAGILSELQILGLIELGDSSVVVRTRFKTQPFLRWRLERDFRRRIKNRFDELGIEIPYPHHTVYFGVNKQGEAPPARIEVKGEAGSEQA